MQSTAMFAESSNATIQCSGLRYPTLAMGVSSGNEVATSRQSARLGPWGRYPEGPA